MEPEIFFLYKWRIRKIPNQTKKNRFPTSVVLIKMAKRKKFFCFNQLFRATIRIVWRENEAKKKRRLVWSIYEWYKKEEKKNFHWKDWINCLDMQIQFIISMFICFIEKKIFFFHGNNNNNNCLLSKKIENLFFLSCCCWTQKKRLLRPIDHRKKMSIYTHVHTKKNKISSMNRWKSSLMMMMMMIICLWFIWIKIHFLSMIMMMMMMMVNFRIFFCYYLSNIIHDYDYRQSDRSSEKKRQKKRRFFFFLGFWSRNNIMWTHT